MNYKKRIYEDRIKKLSKLFKVLFLVGARQVGKSSLLDHLFPMTKVFIFDPLQDLYNARQDPDLFLNSFKPPLILDEIQFAPELLPSIKRKVDATDQKGQYFLTGSQQLSILKNVSESLAGRVAILQIGPMTPHEMYDEFDAQQNWFLSYLKNPDNVLNQQNGLLKNIPSIYEVMWRGGMPGVIELPQDALPIYFSSYIQTYVERDVRLLENIQDLSSFGRFIGLLAALTSQEINYSELGREIGISSVTAKRWLQLLIYTHQWAELLPFHTNSIKRLSEKPKGIINDTGVACYLQRISSPEALAVNPLLGALFESYCFNMLKGFCGALPIMPNFYHWRTLAGAEVDIIIELDGKFYPIEIKCKSVVSKRDASGLIAFKQSYPHLSIAQGIIIYVGQECYQVAEDIIAVPWNLK